MLATLDAPIRDTSPLAMPVFDQVVPEPPRPAPEALLFVVARGASDLAARIEAIFGASVRVIENRRRDPALLPREGREGRRWVAVPAAA